MAGRNQAGKNQTKDLKCATHLLSEKFRNMSEEKKTIVRDLGFGGLMHILPLRVHHQILRELANSLKLGENRLETGYCSFKGKTLKNLTDEMMAIAVDNEQDRLMFKRINKQMAFLLPTTINKISPVHLAPIFEMDTITERNWGGHVLSFIIKGVTDYKLKKKKAIDGCLFALMIIYFHLSKNKDKKRAERPPEPWIANWTKEQLSETEEDSEDSIRKQPSRKTKKMESKKRKKIQEDSDSESESTDESEESSPVEKQKTKKKNSENTKKTQSKKKKIVVDDSSTEQAQSYHEYSTLSEIGSEDLDEFLRENNEKSAAEGKKEADLRSTEGHYVSSETLNLVEESVSEPAEESMMVVRKETPSEGLAITPEPSPPQQLEESTPTLPPTPSKINPAPEDAAALMMMARTASYVPKTDPMPSFSLGLTDSSQEETATQEGASTQDGGRAKTPEIPKLLEQLGDLESGAESFEKFETPARTNENSSDMKEKCYLWAIRVKTYANGLTNEFDNVCRLQTQDRYTLSKLHLASLAPETHIEAEGVFLQPKNNKPFRVEDYPMFIPFLDLKKLASHRYIFAPVCHSQHWWLWLADTRKRKFYIVDPYHTKSPSDERTALNTFIYMLGAPLKSRDKDKEIEPSYLHISGQKTSYNCAIYVMKWLEIFEPANIKRRKYEWDNWTQHEVDHFRVEYASRILFHDINLDKAEAIRGSNAIRLSKPSSLLLSPYYQIDSEDVDTD
ncbi:uncharacterized protein DS421_15g512520 [Arachis hypogaea]|nr:uncharacterized protein DS421_15g512520 [Arachis hypogaea]